MKEFLAKRWFLLSLVVVFALGLIVHEECASWADYKPFRNAIVFTVLFWMAVSLSLKALSSGIRRPRGTLLAVFMNYGVLPLILWTVTCLIQSPEFDGLRGGLLVVAVTPCTLVSAAVWTRRAGGNDSIAIMVTLITNLLCFVIAPLWLLLFFGTNVELKIPFSEMMLKLGLLVVLPMVLAQLTRLHRRWADWATDNKSKLGIAAQCGILTMVFLGSIKVGPEMVGENAGHGITLIGIALAVVLFVHIVVFWLGIAIGRWLKISREDALAVGFAGSQKTLMIGLLICLDLGVLVIPIVLYHASQLIVDTLFADYLKATNDHELDCN
ncbi:MAG: bile acid:sodium symporter [Planctomycetota bacterium]|nr:bile acid:sodium symporter [Planctomycetota bacterium]